LIKFANGWNQDSKQSYAPIIVIAEGAIPQDGDMVTKDQTLDSFGHVKLSGIGEWLAATD
jgi:6-phosphofructokinase 1